MAYTFKRKKHWNGRKFLQYGSAFLVLLIGVAILISWLYIRFQNGSATDTTEPSVTTPIKPEQNTETGHCLLAFDFDGVERFVLIQSNPSTNHITVVPIPSTMADDDGCTLAKALHRHGASKVTNTVSNALSLPLEHYVSFTPKNVEQFLNTLDNGVLFRVPEKVSYTDDNGATISLSAGEHRLSASQVRTLLTYTGWKSASNRSNLAADLVTTVINQYLTQNRSLEGQFSSLSNASTTDLRYDDFYDYQTALSQLASNNNGNICRRVNLPGKKENGFFSPDLVKFRQESGLY